MEGQGRMGQVEGFTNSSHHHTGRAFFDQQTENIHTAFLCQSPEGFYDFYFIHLSRYIDIYTIVNRCPKNLGFTSVVERKVCKNY